MVNRNAGAGTRILIDQLLGSTRPSGYGISRARTTRSRRRSRRDAPTGVWRSVRLPRFTGLGFLHLSPGKL